MKSYKSYLLAVLVVILASNYLDRIALGLVLQDLKVDLHLSDAQLGFLTGIAFALFYSCLGIPIARWADRGDRVHILLTTCLLSGLAVSLCGFAKNFVQLMLIRIAVAVGEAGCIPTAHSLLAEHFPRAERPRAFGIYMLGGSLSVVVGYFVGGWLSQAYGWRRTFMILGAPSMIIAFIAWLSLKEPRRNRGQHGATASAMKPAAAVTIRGSFSKLRSIASFRHLLFAFSIISFFGSGIAQWLPTFFLRTYGFQTAELGSWLALVYGLAGLLGSYIGGELASRYACRNESLQLVAISWACVGFGAVMACVYIVQGPRLAFSLLALATIGSTATYGPVFAAIQATVPEQTRAISIALIYLFANLVGMGLGPLAVGVLSDQLLPVLGNESLRYAMLCLCPGYLWGAWHLWKASRSIAQDIERNQRSSPLVFGGAGGISDKAIASESTG